MENIGFTASGSTVTINQANGKAFQDVVGERGYVWLRSATDGRIVRGKVVANVSLDIGGAHWGLDTKGDVTGAILRIYAINHGNAADDFTPIWGIGYQGGFNYIRNTQDDTTATNIDLPEEIFVNSAITTDNSPMTEVGYAKANFTDSGNTWAFTATFPGESGDGLWHPWTFTITGFSSNPSLLHAEWMSIKKTVFLNYNYFAAGTSNATTYTMTAPIKAGTDDVSGIGWVCADNGANPAEPALVETNTASVTLDLFKNSSRAAWTNVNGKAARVNLTYEAYQP